MTRKAQSTTRLIMRWVIAAFYLGVGVLHITQPDLILPMVPQWVPYPREIVLLTGWCEITGALALQIPSLRRAAGIMLAIYAVCVFPANIKHVWEGLDIAGLPTSWWYHGPRLMFQPVLIWWALFASGVINGVRLKSSGSLLQ